MQRDNVGVATKDFSRASKVPVGKGNLSWMQSMAPVPEKVQPYSRLLRHAYHPPNRVCGRRAELGYMVGSCMSLMTLCGYAVWKWIAWRKIRFCE